MAMKRITIIGLGLIGGSLGLALRDPTLDIIGWDTSRNSVSRALKMGAIDADGKTLAASVESSDLVVLATPLLALPEVMKEMASALPPDATVTDTGSTKGVVMDWAETYLPGINFVGGHPMAGKEVPGVDNAEANLFKGATYCVCPSSNASRSAVDTVLGVVDKVGAVPYFPDPREHDAMVAATSHLPLILSSALMTLVSSSESWREISRVASSGFSGATRLASTVPSMSTGICVTNREAIGHWIDRFVEELLGYKALLAAGDEDIHKGLTAARDSREGWLSGRDSSPDWRPPPVPGIAQQLSSLLVGEALAERGRKLIGLYERGAKTDREGTS